MLKVEPLIFYFFFFTLRFVALSALSGWSLNLVSAPDIFLWCENFKHQPFFFFFFFRLWVQVCSCTRQLVIYVFLPGNGSTFPHYCQ